MLPQLLSAEVHHVEPVDCRVCGRVEEETLRCQLVPSCPPNLYINDDYNQSKLKMDVALQYYNWMGMI